MAKKIFFVLLEIKEELIDDSVNEHIEVFLFKNKKKAKSMLKSRMLAVLDELLSFYDGTEPDYSIITDNMSAVPNQDGLIEASVYLEKEPNFYIADDSQNNFSTIKTGTCWYIGKETIR